jgi:hypothetical protein
MTSRVGRGVVALPRNLCRMDGAFWAITDPNIKILSSQGLVLHFHA